jgi:hypothetical protein
MNMVFILDMRSDGDTYNKAGTSIRIIKQILILYDNYA